MEEEREEYVDLFTLMKKEFTSSSKLTILNKTREILLPCIKEKGKGAISTVFAVLRAITNDSKLPSLWSVAKQGFEQKVFLSEIEKVFLYIQRVLLYLFLKNFSVDIFENARDNLQFIKEHRQPLYKKIWESHLSLIEDLSLFSSTTEEDRNKMLVTCHVLLEQIIKRHRNTVKDKASTYDYQKFLAVSNLSVLLVEKIYKTIPGLNGSHPYTLNTLQIAKFCQNPSLTTLVPFGDSFLKKENVVLSRKLCEQFSKLETQLVGSNTNVSFCTKAPMTVRFIVVFLKYLQQSHHWLPRDKAQTVATLCSCTTVSLHILTCNYLFITNEDRLQSLRNTMRFLDVLEMLLERNSKMVTSLSETISLFVGQMCLIMKYIVDCYEQKKCLPKSALFISLFKKVNQIKGICKITNVEIETLAAKLNICEDFKAPKMFLCPVTQEVMVNPVILASGQVYDKASVEKWFYDYEKDTDPLTNATLSDKRMIPVYCIKAAIDEWRKSKGIVVDTEPLHRFFNQWYTRVEKVNTKRRKLC